LSNLWAHQEKALARLYISEHGLLLSMRMGSGKTRVAATYLDGTNNILVVCPKTVAWDRVWQDEMPHYREVKLYGCTASQRVERYKEAVASEDLTLCVCTYGAVWRDSLKKALLKSPPGALVADECHHIKGASSKVSRAMRLLSKKCDKRLGLSGTLLAQSPLDGWALMRFIDESVVDKSFGRFRDKHAVMGGFKNHEVLSGRHGVPWRNMDEFVEAMDKVCHYDDTTVWDLPVHDVIRKFPMSAAALTAQRDLVSVAVADLGSGIITAANAGVRFMKIQQLSCGFAQPGPMPGELNPEPIIIDTNRRDTLVGVLDEIDPAEPVPVFARFIVDLDNIRQAANIAGRPHFEISGAASELDEWRECRDGAVLGVQVQSGGEGISLVQAAYCILYSLDFSNSNHEQIRGRMARPGQERSPTFIYLDGIGSMDGRIRRSLGSRQSVVMDLYDRLQAVAG